MAILRLLATLTFGITVSTTMTFTAGRPTQSNSTLVANPNTVVANGTASMPLTFTAVDYYGNLAPGVAVTLSASGGNNTFAATSGTTNASGVFVTTLTSTYAQTEVITASFGTSSSITTIVQFVAGAASKTTSSLVLSPNTQVANNSNTILASLTLRDANGNPIPNIAPSFMASGTSMTVSSPSATSASGQSSALYQTPVAQNENALVTAGGLSFIAPMAFVAGPPVAASSTLAASPNIVAGNGSAAISLVTTARDSQGNTAAGASVALSASGGNNTFTAATGTTNSNGTYTTTLTSTLMQTEMITANIAGNFSEATSVTFTGAANANTSTLVVNPNTQTVGPGNLITATLTLRDGASNPLSGISSTWTASGTNNTISHTGNTTSSGAATATYRSTKAQDENVLVTSGGISLVAPVTFVAGSPNATTSYFYAYPKRQIANNSNIITGAVTLLDVYSNPIAGQTASFSASGSNTSNAASAVTNTSGVAQSTFQTSTVQSETAQVSISGFNYTAPMVFTGAPAKCVLTVNPNSVPADGNSQMQLFALVTDANNNALPNVLTTFSSTGGATHFSNFSVLTTSQGLSTTSIASSFAGPNKFIAQAAGVQCVAQGNFTTTTAFCSGSPNYQVSTLTTLSATQGIAIADLNSDGISDIVVTNGSLNKISVYLGAGQGAYSAPAVYPVGTNPYGLTVTDYNCDGSPDVIVTNVGDSSITVYFGSANGLLTLSRTYPTQPYPYAVSSADLDRDGVLDLVVACVQNYGQAAIHLGTSSGVFRPYSYFATSYNPYWAGIADFNGDGFVDLAFPNGIRATFNTLLGDGTGNFATRIAHGTNNSATAGLVVGDFDLDGRQDVATSGTANPNIDMTLQTSSGSFASAVAYPGGNTSANLQIGDFNGDGLPDLVAPGNGTSAVTVLLGNGTGGFGAPLMYTPAGAVTRVAVGDLNGDGYPDIALSSTTTSITLLLYNGCY